MKNFFLVLRVLFGALFIFSGIVKLYPIEPFEYNFVDQGISNWAVATYLARGVISFEVFLGLLLIVGFRMKKFTLPVTVLLLLFFTGYLFVQIAEHGNTENCGCFGTFLEMTPVESIIKNILLLGIAVLLYFYESALLSINKIWFAVLLGLASISTVFILNMPDAYFLKDYDPGYETGPINFDTLPNTFSDSSTVDLHHGKYLLCFFSIKCPHCKQAGFKLSVLKRQHPELQAYVYFWGDSLRINDFINQTNLNLPYKFYQGDDFMRIVGGSVPAIFLVKDQQIVERWDKMNMDIDRIEKEFFR